MQKLKLVARVIGNTNEIIGAIDAMLLYLITGIVVFEVVTRYAFRQPTIWAHDLSTLLFGVYIVVAGGYCLLHRSHVNVDILWNRLPLRIGAAVNLVTYLLLFLFCLALLWKGIEMAWFSVSQQEVTQGLVEFPLWPVKVLVPVGALLLLLQALVKYIGDILTVLTTRRIDL